MIIKECNVLPYTFQIILTVTIEYGNEKHDQNFYKSNDKIVIILIPKITHSTVLLLFCTLYTEYSNRWT